MVEDVGILRLISPGVRNMLNSREHLAERSIETRVIGMGGKKVDPADILRNTVLGYRLNDEKYAPNEEVLSEYEKSLGDDAKVLIVMDFDGVMISPIHLERKVGFKKMYVLSRLVKAADKMVVWTNRLMPQKGRLAGSGRFPFMGKNLATRIEDLGRDPQTGITNVEVRAGKSQDGSRVLQKMIDKGDFEMVYFVGSSKLDRGIVEGLNIADPKKFVYLDTGHYIV